MKKLLGILLFSCALAMLGQNLVPPVGDEWEIGRNIEANPEYEITEYEGQPAFHVQVKSEAGYTLYRYNKKLKPGEYTFSVKVTGESKHGLYTEIYSFDKNGNPAMIMNEKTPEGVLDEMMLVHQYFTVPENSVSVRVGVGVSGNGNGYFVNPQVVAGRQAKPADADTVELKPIQSKWLADWIYLDNDPGVPRVDFAKEITLDAEAASAFVQLTADNGYDLIVNGKTVGSDVEWKSVEVYDIAKFLKVGKNTIAVHVLNYDGVGGLLLQGEVIDATGKSIAIVSDKSWDISLPDGSEAKIMSHGKVPVVPWANVEFHKIVPPKVYNLKQVEAETDIAAGGILHYVYVASQKLLDKKELKVSLRFTDENGRVTPLSAFDEFVRLVPETKLLYVDLATSKYAMPGTYRAEIVGNGFVIPVGNVTISPVEITEKAGYKTPKASMTNSFETDSFKQSLFTYATETPTEEHFRSWATTGGHMYEIAFPAGYWNNKNMFTSVEAERIMLKILEHDPNACIVFKFRIDVPGWWVAKHSDEVFHSNKNRYALQSFCSENWRKDAMYAVCATIDELAARPVGRAISGALVMGFRGGEFQLWGEDVGEYDCSPAAKQAFAKYLQEKGIKEKIELPNSALEFPLKPVDAKGERIRDVYFRFIAERHAENMVYFVRAFREHFGEKYSFGMYFGYGLEYAGGNTRMLLAGHLGLEKLLAEQSPDIISCPLSYGMRTFHRSHAYMYPVDSARLHGVLPIGENDVRNCTNPEFGDSSGEAIKSLADSIEDNRRIRIFEACHGGFVRYLALHPIVDWFYEQGIVRGIRQDNELVMGLQPNPVGGDDEQVVMVANYLEWTKGWRLPESEFFTFAGGARDTLMHTGRAVSYVTFSDYIKMLDKWKNVMIGLPGLMSQEQKNALEAKFGKLPKIKINDGALMLKDGKWTVLDANATPQDIWAHFATDEAKAAGFDTIWYVGGNFKYSWNGKRLKKIK